MTSRNWRRKYGPDVARYFFLMRRGDAQMLFDLDLASTIPKRIRSSRSSTHTPA